MLLAADGPRVIDFGIARALAEMPLTRSDTVMGSPDFLSPEQILDRPVTAATDVFALGSLAAFAATGRLPFGRGQITEVAHRVVQEPPDLTGCPVRLQTLIEACLAKQPEARPAPGWVLEFCLAAVATRTGPGQPASQPWPAWGPTAGAPGPRTRPAGSTTAVLPDLALLAAGGQAAAAEAGRANRALRWPWPAWPPPSSPWRSS